MNPIRQLNDLGQSVWYDNIQRGLITSGALARLIDQGVSGITSNPTIFEKAINGSADYDPAIREAVREGLSLEAIYDRLTLEDIARGADLLRPVFDRTKGADGYISIEVPPNLALDTTRTVHEARRLFKALSRPNVMIKVPATPAGIPAIRQLIADGINVNVTLIFSLEAYDQVISAYVDGLREREGKGLPIDQVASVASFFVSRVDTLVDRLIQERNLPSDLAGKAAIANAKLAYQLFKTRFGGAEFARLKAKGARVQRPLWASTSTKNPNYPQLLYVAGLVGPDTVDTMPPATVEAVLAASNFERTVDQDPAEAKAHIDRLEAQGIRMAEVTRQLLDEGVQSFEASFITLFQGLAKKRLSVLAELYPERYRLGPHADRVAETEQGLMQQHAITRLYDHDASLWSSQPEHVAIIQNALGWLTVPEWSAKRAMELAAFADTVAREGFTDAVVLGMGGSSLVSDVLIHAFPPANGLTLHVLDSTHPDRLAALKERLPLAHTLFIVASKSGSTTEPNAFYHYFWDAVQKAGAADPGRQFIAITDPGTSMEKEARARGFRQVFLNPADIGGRYSALSLFGMVPAALKGLDVAGLLARAAGMAALCREDTPAKNPGARLGAALGALAAAGRDKVTLCFPEPLAAMADWIEQLLAESTGKAGHGLIPVAHEPRLPAARYGQDRVFVAYRDDGEDAEFGPFLDQLAAAGHPVIEFRLADRLDLAGEFYRWEIATAIAGAVIGIDAFDQPNVQESKDNTKRLLAHFAEHGTLPETPVDWGQGAVEARSNRIPVDSVKKASELVDALTAVVKPGDYVALLAYVNPTSDAWHLLQELRADIGARTGVATTLGFGPRFLHSTGQLHKGGPDSGVFLQIIELTGNRQPVPGDGYDFETLLLAQALGDFESLARRNRRVLSVRVQGGLKNQLAKLSLVHD